MKEDLLLLIQKYQEGKSSAFADILLLLQKPMLQYCFRILRDSEDALDVFQDVMIRFHQKLQADSIPDSPLAFIYRMLYHACLDSLRKRKSRFMRDRSQIQLSVPLPEEELRLNQIYACLDLLDEDSRFILILAMDPDLSLKEIGAVLQIPEGTVKSRLFNARKRFRAILHERVG